jgi:hypothetical protein
MTVGGGGAGGSGTGKPVPASPRSRLILGAAVAATIVAGVVAGVVLLNLPRASIDEAAATVSPGLTIWSRD